ncbi:MAG: hypothetical protein FE78DRAFT_38566 [Acidomyces sp. 'richmondensis']|nr:MAG: hypothetical protein FE78DRAFT_38566 [Acidomyces sp. 'richmondensis']
MAKKYLFGFTGHKLRTAQMWTVIFPAYMLFGYNQAVAGGLLGLPTWIATFPRINTATTTGLQAQENSRIQGTVVALYTLGCFFGALSCIPLSDRLGRIRMIQLGSLVHIVGSILQASSFSLGQLIVGRLVAGIGFGALTATAPNWQSECSLAKHRGATVIMESVFISAGLATSAWIDLGMSFTNTSVSWRFPLALSSFFAIVTIIMSAQMPESPRWLLSRGRIEEARQVMAALNGVGEDDPQIQSDIVEINESLAIAGRGHFTDIFKMGELRFFNRACLACAGQMFQQLTGINALAFYLSTIFHEYLGLTSLQAGIVAASTFTFQMVCSPIGVLTVDRFGRRKLMMISAIGMGSCMAIVAGTASQPNNKVAEGVAGSMIFLFSLFFPVGFLGLTFLYASEISPNTVRVPITSMSTATAWIFNFMVALITPVGFSTIGWRYFIIWAAINYFLILPSVYLFFPETSGRHLEEVDQIFRESKSFFDPVRKARHFSVVPVSDIESNGPKLSHEKLEVTHK